jgi:deazaflavin-dependent oxidoreductase (nitroreductase family)
MSPIVRKIFWFLNRYFMVPLFRLGLGAFFVNPLAGYIMILKPIGRKSGKTRYAPVNYAIQDGAIYCVSGGRQSSEWFRNIRANPNLELILPAGAIYAHAEEVTDPDEKRIAARQVLQNAGFAGFFEGYNPYKISDSELQTRIADLPVLRFQPLGLGSGAFDMGGWAWSWSLIATVLLIWILLTNLK